MHMNTSYALSTRRVAKFTFLLAAILCSTALYSQSNLDTITLSNGDEIIGEIKSMEKAVVQIETDYSDADFKIDWDNVIFIRSSSTFLFNLENGDRINGIMNTDPEDPTSLIIRTDDGREVTTSVTDIVYLHSVKSGFISRLSASIGIGLSLTKANNLRQFNTRSSIGYTGNTWQLDASYNQLFSSQDSVASTKRTDASIGAQWYLPKDWFIYASSTFLSNTEQKLKLRSTPQVGIGKYLVRDNALYLSASAGLGWNIENFEMDDDDRSSLEGVIGIEANLFDTGDLSLFTKAVAYPSITESGRFRSDINFDLKYDFPYDIYIKFGFTFNYDNQPAEGASDNDYIFQWTVGWDL